MRTILKLTPNLSDVVAQWLHHSLLDERSVTERRFPNIDKNILKYVPYSTGEYLKPLLWPIQTDLSTDGGWDYSPSKQYYWDEDIRRISAQHGAIQDPEVRRAWEAERAAAIEKRREVNPCSALYLGRG